MKSLKFFLFILFLSFYNNISLALPKYNGQCFIEAANKYGVRPRLLYAIAKVESDFNPYAINVNAHGRSIKVYYPENKDQAKVVLNYLLSHGYNFDLGIAQINIVNIRSMGLDPYKLLDPCQNLDVSAILLKSLINRYGFNWQAIWRYNGRPSYAYKVYHALLWLRKHPNYYAFGNP